jgi:hypothetical protein
MAFDYHVYDLANGGVEKIKDTIPLVRGPGDMLFHDLGDYGAAISHGVELAGGPEGMFYHVGPGADVVSGEYAMHYRPLMETKVVREISRQVCGGKTWIYEAQRGAQVAPFQAVCQCWWMKYKLGIEANDVTMLCDWVTDVATGGFKARSRSMGRCNGTDDREWSQALFERLGLLEYWEGLWQYPFFETDELVPSWNECLVVPSAHDGISRWGSYEADGEDGTHGGCELGFTLGGWNMVALRMGQHQVRSLRALMRRGAAIEGEGDYLSVIANSVMSGPLYEEIRKLARWSYKRAAREAARHLPWRGTSLPVENMAPAVSADRLIEICGDKARALAAIIEKTAELLDRDARAIASAVGMELPRAVSIYGGPSENAALRGALERRGYSLRIPRHAATMTADAAAADALRRWTIRAGDPIDFGTSLRIVHCVRDGH